MNNNKPPQNPVYLGEVISVGFNKAPIFRKKPACPDKFTWQGKIYFVNALLSEWADFSRKGKNNRNMKDAHLELAKVHGSLGVGKFYFRVQTTDLRVFDLYYDRAIKNAFDSDGYWVLFQELFSD
jgi:hypothetical protein